MKYEKQNSYSQKRLSYTATASTVAGTYAMYLSEL